ncbi:MAG: Amuc_1098 family type IV pilus outer membrane protein [Chthoniobacterales bacterium]
MKRILSVALGAVVLSAGAFAQDAERIAEREVARRQAALPSGSAALARGQASMAANNYAQAHEEFRAALLSLPDAVTSGDAHEQALKGFCKSGLKLAEIKIAEGNYAGAEMLCREILSDRYDPNCRPAMELLAHLQTPGHFNKTMTPNFLAKVDEVKKLLTEADGFYNSGRYDLAFKRYDQVLALDPYNTAARRGQEKINLTRTHYGEEAYNETRSRATWQVQQAWEDPVRQYGRHGASVTNDMTREATGTARITNKLNSIIIPRIEFRDASIREAIDFLREQAAEHDPTPEGKRGVDIVLRLTAIGGRAAPETITTTTTIAPSPAAPLPQGNAPPPATNEPPVAAVTGPSPVIAVPAAPAVAPGEPRITITLNQIPLGEALRYIAAQANLKVKIEPYAVSIIPTSEQSQELITKEYRVPPGFIQSSVTPTNSMLNQAASTAAHAAIPVGTAKDTVESTGGQQLVRREGAKEYLESEGVPFPPGASAQFLPQSSRLVVRNTPDALELVDAIVEQANVAVPRQVEIESKFVEVNQNNLKELGFDWLLGQFNIGNKKVFGGGGTSGTGQTIAPADWPFTPPNGQPIGQFPVTAGNRSGNLAISGSAIDALLMGTGVGQVLAPGIFGLSGVFTDPQFQLVIRALNQKKGIDLLSAPRVTTKSGQRALIEIVREFRYPTQFTPPILPNLNSGGNGGGVGTTVTLPVIAPTTPSAFETRNTGVTLEVEPVVGPDGITIDLNLVPQVVEFEGFINYGSPINTVNPALLGLLNGGAIATQLLGNEAIRLTDNVINQPIFSTRKVTTSVSVWDGQTVVLGGLMREDVQKSEDRTPIIGDIPLVGRLFRSTAEQHIKRNLVIFVTARLVNPGGQPVNVADDEEEIVEPPVLPEIPMYKK